MSATTVRDKVAAKILALPSSKRVYSNASTNPALAPWPSELLDDGPHALVRRGATNRTGGTGNQFVERMIDVEWWISGLDVGEVERKIDTLEDQIVTEFSSGITLGGSVVECVYAGSDAPRDVDDQAGRPWVVWVTHFGPTKERYATEMTP